MAYVMSDAMRSQIEADAKKMKNQKPFPERARNTKYAGSVEAERPQQVEEPAALIKTASNNSEYKISDNLAAKIRQDIQKKKNVDVLTVAPSPYEPVDMTPYKTYYQPQTAGDKGTGRQMTKEYSQHRLDNEAYNLYTEYGDKSYTEIQAAIDAEEGTDYMSQYRKGVLTQIGKDNRTRDDITNDIAATDRELEIAQAEWDRIADEYVTTDGEGYTHYQEAQNRVNTLIERKQQLESELWTYDKGTQYGAMDGYSDFAKNSKPTGYVQGAGVYNYINNINGTADAVKKAAVKNASGENLYAKYDYMTDKEIARYNYLFNVAGEDTANEYLSYLNYYLNDRYQNAYYTDVREAAARDKGTAAVFSLMSVTASLTSGTGLIDVLGQKLARAVTGSDAPIDYNRAAQKGYTFAQAARDGSMSGMSETGKFIYSSAMSMAESLGVLGAGLVIGPAASLLLSGSAATSMMHDAKEAGATDGQAIAMGIVAGAAEYFAEKVPLEELLNFTSVSGAKAIFGQIFKQAGIEATEETLTTLANTAAEVLILGEKSSLAQSYKKYIEMGYSEDEAERLAKNEWLQGLALDALGGFMSGLVFGGGGTAITQGNTAVDRYNKGKAISTSEYTLSAIIEEVEQGDYSTETKQLAADIKADIAMGNTVGNVKKGKLADMIIKDNPQFEAEILPGIMLKVQNQEDAAAAEGNNTGKKAEPKMSAVERMRSRLQQRKQAKNGKAEMSPEAAKILAQEVVNSKRTYSDKTRETAQAVLDNETVNDADVKKLINGIKTDNIDFADYTAEEMIAEASIAAQEMAEAEAGAQTSEEIKTAVPQSRAQQSEMKGDTASEQRTAETGDESGEAEGDTVRSDRGRGRFSDAYSGDGAPVGRESIEENRRREAQIRRASDRLDRIAAVRAETASPKEAGLENGSEDPSLVIVPESIYDREMESVVQDAEKHGLNVTFFTGEMETKDGSSAPAVIIGDNVWIKVDSTLTIAELYDHEKFHKVFRKKAGMIKALAEWITENYSREEFERIARTYYKKYKNVYDFDSMTEEEQIAAVTEEILADAFAGTNKFGAEASAYADPARAAVEIVGEARPSEYNDNPSRGPPEGMTYDDVKNAVREVLAEVMGTEGNINTADDSGEKYAVNNKYWHPSMTPKEIQEVRELAKHQIYTTNNYIDDGNKWLYDNKKGHRYFAIYSTSDAENPTVLYACKDDRAEYEQQILNEFIGEEYQHESNEHGPKTIDRILERVRNNTSDGTDYNNASLGARSNNGNAKIYSSNKRNRPSKALLNCLENIKKIQERRRKLRSDVSDSDIRFSVSDDYDYDIAPEYRTVEDVEDENVNVYAYDHPELKQYYRRVARDMLVDLTRVTSYEAERGWYRENTLGNADTTDAINNLLEDAAMPYGEIRNALKAYTTTDAIPEELKTDENLKFLEIEMDRLLREGYSTVFGNKRFASKKYIEAVENAESDEEQDGGLFAYDEYLQESKDEYIEPYFEEIYTEDADEAYIERRERERADEIAAEQEAQNAKLQERREADRFFYAANQDAMDNAEEDISKVIDDVREAAKKEGADVDEAQLRSVEAQALAIESEHLRKSTIAWLAEEGDELPDGVTAEEAQAAVDEKYQAEAGLKELAEEPMEFEESVAALEEKSKDEEEEYLDRRDRKNFRGTNAMEALPMPIRIAQSVTDYSTEPDLMKRAIANGFIIRNMDKKLNAMHTTATERSYARRILLGAELSSLPTWINKERILDIVECMLTKRAARTDTLSAQKTDIKRKYRALAVEQFKEMENAKRVRLANLNYMTPRRAMIELFGEKRGKEVYEAVFEPIRQNDAERVRFTQTMKSAAKHFEGADGKREMLTRAESALVQMLMEGKAAQEMVAKMETETKEEVETRAAEILKERQEKQKKKAKSKTDGSKTEDVTETEEVPMDFEDKNERAAQLYSVYLEVQEALKTGKYHNERIDAVRINNAAEHFTKQYNLLYNAINEFRVSHGDLPIGFIKGYAPHMQSEKVLTPFEKMYQWMEATSDIGELPAEIAGRSHTFRPNSVYNRHFLPRGYNSETEYNVYKGFDEYVEKVSQMFYHQDDIMRLREISRYLRKNYVTEDGRVLLNGLNAVLDKGYEDKVEFLEDAKIIHEGERLSAERVEEALEAYGEKLFEKYKDSQAVNGAVVVWLDNYTNLLVEKQNAIDRGLEALVDRGGIKLINSIINKAVSRSVVGNLGSAFSQTAQLPMIIAESGVGNTIEALRDFATRGNELRRFAYENDFLVTRKGTELLDYATSDKIVNAMAIPMEVVDFFISTLAARSAYYQGLRQGMTADEAMKYSVQKAENIMGSRNVATKPVGFSSKHPVMRLLNAFQIEATSFVQHYFKDLPSEYKEIVRKKGKKAAVKKIVGVYLLYAILAFLYNRGMEEATGKTPAQLDFIGIALNFAATGKGLTVNDYIGRTINRNNENVFETELPEEFDWAGATKSTLQMAIDETPLTTNALSIAGFGDDQNIATAAIANAWDYFKLAVDDFFVTRKEKEDDDETNNEVEVIDGLINIAKIPLQFAPGGNQVQKWIEGAIALTGHGYTNKKGELVYPVRGTAWEWFQTMVVGKSALENAREYYASGASPLSSTRNEQYFAMVENGVDEEEAYRTAQIINDIESDHDENGNTIDGSQMLKRIEYVMEKNYTDEVKNLLAMSIASDAAQEKYVEKDLESQGVDAAEYFVGYAYYAGLKGTKENPMSKEEKAEATAKFLEQQGVNADDIAIIVDALK